MINAFKSELKHKQFRAFLIILIVIAGIFWVTRTHVLSYDEYRDLYLAKALMNGEYSYYGDAYYKHPPLYMIILSVSSRIFGFGEDAGYIISILFGLSTAVLTYLLVSKFINKKLAIPSSLILIFNPWFSKYSRDLRFEIATMFFMFLTLYFFYSYAQSKKKRSLALTGVSLGLGLLTKTFVFLIIPALAIFLLALVYKKSLTFTGATKSFVSILIIAAIVYSPWMAYTQINGGPSQFFAQSEEFSGNVRWNPDYVSPPAYFYILELPNLLTIPILLLAIAGLLLVNRKSRIFYLIGAWIIFHIAFVSIMGYKETRFIMYLVPVFSIAAAAGANKLLEKFNLRKLLPMYILVIVLIIPGILAAENPIWQEYPTPKNWDLWQYLQQNVDRNEYVLANDYGMVELYSNPSDVVVGDWQFDAGRYLSFDSKYALLEPKVTYVNDPDKKEIFSKVQEFYYNGPDRKINLTLYKVDTQKLSALIYGNAAIGVKGKLSGIPAGNPINKGKIILATGDGQAVNVFYTKPNGEFVLYLPLAGQYLINAKAFGYQEGTFLMQTDGSQLVICTSQTNCFQKNSLDLSLQFKSFISHGYADARF